MAGIWRNNPETPEGKYPIMLRRDGSPVENRFFGLLLKDPGAPAAFRAYAAEHRRLGSDPVYVADILKLADEAEREFRRARHGEIRMPDPDAPPHRKDDPAILAWARSIGCPGN